MNLVYTKNRILISFAFYFITVMLYLVVSNILIPKLKPAVSEHSRFALSLISNAKVLEPVKQKELEPSEVKPLETKEPVKPQEILKPVSTEVVKKEPPKPVIEEKPKPVEKPKPTVEKSKPIIEQKLDQKPSPPKLLQNEKPSSVKPNLKEKSKEEKEKEIQLKKKEEELRIAAEAAEKERQLDLQRVVTGAIYDDSSLNNASPKYPIISRKEGEEGEVVLLVKVDASGAPVDVVLIKSSGYERLDNASMYAVKNWKFKPAKNRFGDNVESVLQIPFQFKIE